MVMELGVWSRNTAQQRLSCEGKCFSLKAISPAKYVLIGQIHVFHHSGAQVLTGGGGTEAGAQGPKREGNGRAGLTKGHLCLSLSHT